jgi:hypothetical protein
MDVIAPSTDRNETRLLSLMLPLRVNSGTVGGPARAASVEEQQRAFGYFRSADRSSIIRRDHARSQ